MYDKNLLEIPCLSAAALELEFDSLSAELYGARTVNFNGALKDVVGKLVPFGKILGSN